MAGFGAGMRALAAAASRHLIHHSASFRNAVLADEYLRSASVLSNVRYAQTKAKKRERANRYNDSDDEMVRIFECSRLTCCCSGLTEPITLLNS
jgi:hypothetical protein